MAGNDKEASYGDVTSEGTTANYVVELKKMNKSKCIRNLFSQEMQKVQHGSIK